MIYKIVQTKYHCCSKTIVSNWSSPNMGLFRRPGLGNTREIILQLQLWGARIAERLLNVVLVGIAKMFEISKYN